MTRKVDAAKLAVFARRRESWPAGRLPVAFGAARWLPGSFGRREGGGLCGRMPGLLKTCNYWGAEWLILLSGRRAGEFDALPGGTTIVRVWGCLKNAGAITRKRGRGSGNNRNGF